MNPKYYIIIHNDDIHYAHLLVETLMRVFGYNKEYSEFLVRKVHNEKDAIVWCGALEAAEFKVSKLREIEPDIHGSISPILLSVVPL